MQFAVLGSGSRGNAVVVRQSDCAILIDCGFSLREISRRAASLGINLADVSALLVTHEHGDHCRGVGAFARRYQTPVYMTSGTFQARDFGVLPDLRLIQADHSFSIGGISIRSIAVPHDAAEPVQYVCSYAGKTLGLLTDLGFVTPAIVSAYQQCDALILEANHDPAMLAAGVYPPYLKRRVAGDWGHLNNRQAAAFVDMIQAHRLQQLVIAHISEKNNAIDLLQLAFADSRVAADEIFYAEQDNVSPWFVIESTIVA